tara:strand:+ start:2484 stop:3059 length:576 start_codon:yes stop_codon:yes gene_type:complete
MLLSTNPDLYKKNIALWGNYNDFPKTLKEKLREFQNIFKKLLEIQRDQKIGKNKDDDNYELYSSFYGSSWVRWWYDENREKTQQYLDKDFSNYMKFLNELIYNLEKDSLNLYTVFRNDVIAYNRKLIESLYVLKETYQNGRGDTKKIIAKIDSIILTLIDFKDNSNKIIAKNKSNASSYTSFDDSVLSISI